MASYETLEPRNNVGVTHRREWAEFSKLPKELQECKDYLLNLKEKNDEHEQIRNRR